MTFPVGGVRGLSVALLLSASYTLGFQKGFASYRCRMSDGLVGCFLLFFPISYLSVPLLLELYMTAILLTGPLNLKIKFLWHIRFRGGWVVQCNSFAQGRYHYIYYNINKCPFSYKSPTPTFSIKKLWACAIRFRFEPPKLVITSVTLLINEVQKISKLARTHFPE